MPRGIRQEGRVALSDFFPPEPPPAAWKGPEGWDCRLVFSLGLFDYRLREIPGNASYAVREARSYFFTFPDSDYPHLVAKRHIPLAALCRCLARARGLGDDADSTGRYVRATPALVSCDRQRVILISGDSRKIWYTNEPSDVDWDLMHYDERLLTLEAYQEIVKEDPFAFLKAIGVRIPENMTADE